MTKDNNSILEGEFKIKLMIEELQEIVDTKGDCVLDKSKGLCEAVTHVFVKEFIISWEHFSGSPAFPIRDKHDPKKVIAQFTSRDKWEGRQLNLRLSLASHLLKCYISLYESTFKRGFYLCGV